MLARRSWDACGFPNRWYPEVPFYVAGRTEMGAFWRKGRSLGHSDVRVVDVPWVLSERPGLRSCAISRRAAYFLESAEVCLSCS